MTEQRTIGRWGGVLGITVAFIAAVQAVPALVDLAIPPGADWSPRAQVMIDISAIAAAQLLVLAGLRGFLRSKGRSFRDLGLWKGAPWLGWGLALLMAALLIAGNLAGTLRDQLRLLTEVSVFHVYSSLVAGLSAGFCEEIIFRGFVMSELEEAGHGKAIQVSASGLLFGAAHLGIILATASSAGWTLGIYNFVIFAVLGTLWAGIYLASRRSLMPVIASHALNDLVVIPLLFLAVQTAGSAA